MEQEERERFNIRNILNERAVKNAFVVDMAMGGSSNTILHMLAIANEAGVDFNIADIIGISKRVSHIARFSPKLNKLCHMPGYWIRGRGGKGPELGRGLGRRGGNLRGEELGQSSGGENQGD